MLSRHLVPQPCGVATEDTLTPTDHLWDAGRGLLRSHKFVIGGGASRTG